MNDISFKVGYNFDRGLAYGLVGMNAWAKENDMPWRVGEVFGSLPSVNPIGTARPSFRLTDGSEALLRDHVELLAKRGIGFNYTLNVSMVDPRVLKERDSEIAEFLVMLEDVGVERVTVAHPLVGKIVHELSRLPMEISTISQVRNARQLIEYKERFPRVDKLCVDVMLNRDWEKLTEISDAAHRMGVDIEFLVNEFCVADCIDRNFCYDIHSLDLSQDERKLFNSYPMGNCISKRIREPVEWLKARFILPQWVPLYAAAFDARSFKISGRTHPTPYVLRVARAYVDGAYSGNLLELWADVENIGKAFDDYREPRVNIDVSKLPQHFLDFYKTSPTVDEEERYLEGVFALASA